MGEVVKLPQPDDWKNLLEVFLFEKKAEGRAPRTISDYKLHVSNFFKRFPDALRSDKELLLERLEAQSFIKWKSILKFLGECEKEKAKVC